MNTYVDLSRVKNGPLYQPRPRHVIETVKVVITCMIIAFCVAINQEPVHAVTFDIPVVTQTENSPVRSLVFTNEEHSTMFMNNTTLPKVETQEEKFQRIQEEAREEAERQEAIRREAELQEQIKKTVYPQDTTQVISSGSISQYTNLAVYREITADDMNRVIDYWNYKCNGTPFSGQGQLFINAAKETGLDPIYLFAHAAVESGFGKSALAVNKGNYFGIAAYNSSPYQSAYVMGDTLNDGIMNGATWIKREYYDNGQQSLYDMIYKYPGHVYAQYDDGSPNTKWMGDILNIMHVSESIVESEQF